MTSKSVFLFNFVIGDETWVFAAPRYMIKDYFGEMFRITTMDEAGHSTGIYYVGSLTNPARDLHRDAWYEIARIFTGTGDLLDIVPLRQDEADTECGVSVNLDPEGLK